MRRLTILSVAFPFAAVDDDPVGGAEQVLATLDRALVAAGHRSIVIAAAGSRAAGELIAIPRPCGRIGAAERFEAHALLRRLVPEAALRCGVDLIHMHGVDFSAYLPPPSLPVLATLHLPFGFYEERALRPERERVFFNCVSHAQYRSAEADPRIVAVIENGVPKPSEEPRQRGSFALAMGRICPEKGFHLAFDAAARAGMRLRLAGQLYPYPEHEDHFREQIAPRLDRRRRWIGAVRGRRKCRLLGSARCLLAPSLVAETASLVAREALAAGAPVIAFPSGALADVVEPGVTGFLVRDVAEMAEAMAHCATIDPAACRAAARERFSIERMAKQYLDLYERLSEAA